MERIELCDIDQTIFVDGKYAGGYHYEHDNVISYDVHVGAYSKSGYADSESEMTESIQEWLERYDA